MDAEPPHQDPFAALGRETWRYAVVMRDGDLFATALIAFTRGDEDRVDQCMCEVIGLYNEAERLSLFSAEETQTLRRGWLTFFAAHLLDKLTAEDRRRYILDPDTIAKFLPLRQRAAVLRNITSPLGGRGRAA